MNPNPWNVTQPHWTQNNSINNESFGNSFEPNFSQHFSAPLSSGLSFGPSSFTSVATSYDQSPSNAWWMDSNTQKPDWSSGFSFFKQEEHKSPHTTDRNPFLFQGNTVTNTSSTYSTSTPNFQTHSSSYPCNFGQQGTYGQQGSMGLGFGHSSSSNYLNTVNDNSPLMFGVQPSQNKPLFSVKGKHKTGKSKHNTTSESQQTNMFNFYSSPGSFTNNNTNYNDGRGGVCPMDIEEEDF